MDNKEINMPLLSVVIPVYNVQKYLHQCLDSVINQTYEKLEVLIVDDGSTDTSGEICDEYAATDNRIRVFHIENRGLSGARNYALDRVKGEYVTFLDSDDWLEQNAYHKLIDKALETNADIVSSRYFRVFINKKNISKGSEKGFVVYDDEIIKKHIFEQTITSGAWDKIYKADIFSSIRYPEGRVYEDYATTYLLLQKAKIFAYIPDKLINYRMRKNSISHIHSMRNLCDYWKANYERFTALAPMSKEFYEILLLECFRSIDRMWRWYYGFSKIERKESRSVINEMEEFSKKYGLHILCGRKSALQMKCICMYTRSSKIGVFLLLYMMNQIFRLMTNDVLFET